MLCLCTCTYFKSYSEINFNYRYRVAIVFLTFWTYTFFHMSRKAISVVKTVFLNCTDHEHDDEENDFHNGTCTSFISKKKHPKD